MDHSKFSSLHSAASRYRCYCWRGKLSKWRSILPKKSRRATVRRSDYLCIQEILVLTKSSVHIYVQPYVRPPINVSWDEILKAPSAFRRLIKYMQIFQHAHWLRARQLILKSWNWVQKVEINLIVSLRWVKVCNNRQLLDVIFLVRMKN